MKADRKLSRAKAECAISTSFRPSPDCYVSLFYADLQEEMVSKCKPANRTVRTQSRVREQQEQERSMMTSGRPSLASH